MQKLGPYILWFGLVAGMTWLALTIVEAGAQQQHFIDACHAAADPYKAVIVNGRCYRLENAEGDLVQVQVEGG